MALEALLDGTAASHGGQDPAPEWAATRLIGAEIIWKDPGVGVTLRRSHMPPSPLPAHLKVLCWVPVASPPQILPGQLGPHV